MAIISIENQILIEQILRSPYLIPLGILEIITISYLLYRFKPHWLSKIAHWIFP